MSCECCDAPPVCDAPSIDTKHVAAAAAKCGFEEFSDPGREPPVDPSTPPKFYLQRETLVFAETSYDESKYDDHYVMDYSKHMTTTETVDPADCSVATECEGDASRSYTCHYESYNPEDPPTPLVTDCSDSYTWNPCEEAEPDGNGCHCGLEGTGNFEVDCNGTVSETDYDDLSNTHSKVGFLVVSECHFEDGLGFDGGEHDEQYTEVTLSSEETTGSMKDRAVLPDFPEEWGGGGAYSSMVLSADETSYAVSAGKLRLSHGPSATGHFKVGLVETFTPTGGVAGAPIPFATYTWTGSYTDPAEIFYSPTYDIDPPATDGTRSVTVQKFSYLPGYTPPDDGSADGWPV